MNPQNHSVKTLTSELTNLEISYARAKHLITFQKKYRTYGEMAKVFGKNVPEEYKDTPIWFDTLDKFKEQIKIQIKDRYANRRMLEWRPGNNTDNTSNDRFELQDLESGTAIVCTVNSIREIERTQESISSLGEVTPYKDESSESRGKIKYNPKFPDQKAKLLVEHCNQVKAAQEIWDLLENGETGVALLAATGSGKTFILGSVIKNFLENGYIEKYKSYAPHPIFYVTKTTVVEQTEKVLKEMFNVDTYTKVRVVNVEHLRSSMGKLYVKEHVDIVNGKECVVYKWNKLIHPVLFIWDECQILAREDSTQSRIAQAANDIIDMYGEQVIQIFASATPFSRVIEGKCFACATRTTFDMGMQTIQLTNESWKMFARQISLPDEPEVYSEEAIKNFTKFFDKNIVRINGIKPKHRSFVGTQKLNFQSQEERDEYEKAVENYNKKKAKIEGDESLSEGQKRFMLLAQFNIYRKAAENCRRYHFAEWIVKTWDAGKAPGLGLAFKQTQTNIYKILVEDYGWCREDVSMIWGGSTESLSAKQKMAKRIKEAGLLAEFDKMGLTLEDLGIDVEIHERTNEQYEFEKAHRLLSQKPEERERERLRFQRQDSKLLMFNYKSGGIGLTASHEGDADYIPIYPKARPREGMFTPIYSEKEAIQGLGRFPRITSASDTYQYICFYSGTIEEQVMRRLIMKLKCVKAVVGDNSESWEDVITGKKLFRDIDNETKELEDGSENVENLLNGMEIIE